MKDFLNSLLQNHSNPIQKRNMIREYLQARILEFLQQNGAMIPLAFQGGTALRFLFNLARFSEDLDFALEGNSEHYDLRLYLKKIQNGFNAEGYLTQIKINDQRTVHSAFIQFPELFYEFGLTPHKNERLSIKLEVDTNPPAGAKLETRVIRKFIPLNLQYHDRASLFSGKIHAILQRNYPKGRDLYDLMWYLSDPTWPEPNLIMLNHALQQTNWTGPELNTQNWSEILEQRLQTLDWDTAIKDVQPFLERPHEIELITPENLGKLLKGKH